MYVQTAAKLCPGEGSTMHGQVRNLNPQFADPQAAYTHQAGPSKPDLLAQFACCMPTRLLMLAQSCTQQCTPWRCIDKRTLAFFIPLAHHSMAASFAHHRISQQCFQSTEPSCSKGGQGEGSDIIRLLCIPGLDPHDAQKWQRVQDPASC